MSPLVVLLLFLASCCSGDKPAVVWNATLDDPPSQRWAHIQEAYASEIVELISQYFAIASPHERWIYSKLMGIGYIDSTLHDELETLARVTNSTYADIAFLNYMYEFNSKCTSVIVRKQDGTILHGRNLDYGLGKLLRDTTVTVNVYKGGKLLYIKSWFPWYIGVNTGMRVGEFSISLNQRDSGSTFTNVLALLMGFQGNNQVIRKALNQANTYTEAQEMLANTQTVADSYDMIAGTETGSIITRHRWYTDRISQLNESTWYLVQTNHDMWTPSPKGDNRSEVAIAYIESIGREDFTLDSMYSLLSTHPVLNPTTVFTTLMVPSTGEFRNVIRE